jgi:excisionase family DNA binding protein
MPISAEVELDRDLLSSSQAAKVLGVSLRTFKRLVAQRKIVPDFRTPGGHERFKRESIEALLQQSAGSGTSAMQLSPLLKRKREDLEELKLEVEMEKAETTLTEIREEKRRRRQAEEDEKQEQRDLAAQERAEATAEEDRRRREHRETEMRNRAEAARRKWQQKKLQLALRALPPFVPQEVILEVTESVNNRLQSFAPDEESDIVVDRIILAIATKAARPYVRANEAERASSEAIKELPLLARGYSGQPSEWDIKARQSAIAEIGDLPESATFDRMCAAARVAGKRVAREYEHGQQLARMIAGVHNSLPGLLRYSSAQEKAKAENAVRSAFADLPIGASVMEFTVACDQTLAPFVRADAEAKAAHEAAAAEAAAQREAAAIRTKIERDADWCIGIYLDELEARPEPDGLDFQGEKKQIAEQIKRDILPKLMETPQLSYDARKQRARQLVDVWLTRRLAGTA